MIAISLLAFVASVAVHMLITTQHNASQSHINARTATMRDSLAGYVGHAFHNDTLDVNDAISKAGLSGLPDHLDENSLDVLPIICERARYQDGLARCVLVQDATISPALIAFSADCIISDDNMPQASFAPCGYFIEWGGISQSQPLLAETRSILFDEWAEICF